MTSRTIYQQDAISWLGKKPRLGGCSFVTSLPDLSELSPMTLPEWKMWFESAAQLIFSRCADDGVSIFFQSDIKHDGIWIDKSYLIQKAAEACGHSLLWHKIACRLPAGNTAYSRAAYSHLLCFSQGVRAEIGKSTADVLPELGKVTWKRGMGVNACRLACQFILTHTNSHTVIDPFCGHGTVLAVANDMGLNAIGVELGAKRARKARSLKLVNAQLIFTNDELRVGEPSIILPK